MFSYYLDLALRSFKRHRVLTALMVLALGLGIGASITTLTVLKLLSGDPLPQKSARLFVPELDPLPTDNTPPADLMRRWGNLMTYTDAMNLLRCRTPDKRHRQQRIHHHPSQQAPHSLSPVTPHVVGDGLLPHHPHLSTCKRRPAAPPLSANI